jgi:hypothetical protein
MLAKTGRVNCARAIFVIYGNKLTTENFAFMSMFDETSMCSISKRSTFLEPFSAVKAPFVLPFT